MYDFYVNQAADVQKNVGTYRRAIANIKSFDIDDRFILEIENY